MPPAAPQTSVGADSISARGPRRITRIAGGACPSPTNHGKRPAKRDGLHHPGGRRAGCPHPAAPRAAATPAGGYGIRPYNQRRARGQPGNRCPCAIINLCRGRCLHRPANIAPPQGLREGHGPPLQTTANARPTGMAPPTRAAVGRDALIPPHPAPPRTPAGGYGIRPYNQRRARRPTGKPLSLRYNKPL